MERVEDAAFGPDDRIGQLTMRNLDIADSRARLEQYAAQGIVTGETAKLMGDLKAGGGREIIGGEEADAAVEAVDRPVTDSGID
jgi:argininosuccinate synthase